MERISSIAIRLKEYRDKNNLTLAELSSKTGIPAQTLNRYELGQRAPKIDVAVQIAEAIGVNPLWLQGYDTPIDADSENKIKPAEPELDELDKELLRLTAKLTPEQKKRQVEMLRDIVGKKDS